MSRRVWTWLWTPTPDPIAMWVGAAVGFIAGTVAGWAYL